MNAIRQLLDEILDAMSRMKRPVVDYLDRGLHKSEILQKTAQLPYSISGELEELYSWRNGTRILSGVTTDAVCFFPGYYLLSLDSAIENYNLLMHLKEDPEIMSEMKWKEEWFPVFTNSAGDYYAAKLDKVRTAESPVLGCFSYRLPLGQPVTRNVEIMFRLLLECYRTGVIFVDNDGYLTMNYEDFRTIALRLNGSG